MMATTNPKDTTPALGALASTTEWRVAISEVVAELTGLVLTMTDHQVDTRIYRLGHLSYEGRLALDRQTLEERRVRAENAQQGHPAPSADIPTPGDWRTVAADANLTTALRHASRQLIRHYKARDVPAPAGSVQNPTIRHLLRYVDDLAQGVTDTRLLSAVHRDLDTVREETERAIDGVGRDLLNDPCPYCGLVTLVVDFRDDTVQCGPDPKTGITHPCVCPDPLCQCKNAPVTFRHTWYRNPQDERLKQGGSTWSKLAGRLKFHRQPNQ